MSRPELHLGTIFEQNIIVTHGQRALEIGYKKARKLVACKLFPCKETFFFDVGKGSQL